MSTVSVVIDNIKSDMNTTFTTTPKGVTPSIDDNSELGATTSYVNSISNNIIQIGVSNIITTVLNFTSIVTNLIKGGTTKYLTFTGNVSLGRSDGTTTFLGTNPFITNYPYWVSTSGTNCKIQAGNARLSNGTSFIFPTNNNYTTSSITVFTPYTTSCVVGSSSSNKTSVTFRTTATTSVNFITIGN